MKFDEFDRKPQHRPMTINAVEILRAIIGLLVLLLISLGGFIASSELIANVFESAFLQINLPKCCMAIPSVVLVYGIWKQPLWNHSMFASFKEWCIGTFVGSSLIALGFGFQYLFAVVHIAEIIPNENVLSAIWNSLCTAFAEELLFRVGVVSVFMRYFPASSYKKFAAIIISSVIFAVAHGMNNGFTILPAIELVLAGILLGVYYVQTSSVWLSIGLHFAWNVTEGAILGFVVSGSTMASLCRLEYTSENSLLTGGEFGFEGSLPAIIVTLLGIVFVSYFARSRALLTNAA